MIRSIQKTKSIKARETGIKVSSIMTGKVLTIPEDAVLAQAIGLLYKKGGGMVIVINGNKPVGVISETDIIGFIAKEISLKTRLKSLEIQPIASISYDKSLSEVGDMILKFNVKWLIVKRGAKIVGIINERNVLLGALLEESILKEERKKSQLELVREKISVEKKVIIRTRELKEEKKRVEELLESKNRFINQLSHDLRTPLTPLMALLPIALEKAKNDEQKKIIDVCIRNSKYLNDMVLSILNFARLEGQKVEYDFEKTDVNELIFETLSERAFKNSIIFDKEQSKGSFAFVDKTLIKEVINNLIGNSEKFSSEKKKIFVGIKAKEDYIIIKVKDNGLGMTKQTIKNLFGEFFKADQSRHDQKSFGLGLSICKRIINAHGGEIWAKSRGLGKGSEFYFSIKTKKVKS